MSWLFGKQGEIYLVVFLHHCKGKEGIIKINHANVLRHFGLLFRNFSRSNFLQLIINQVPCHVICLNFCRALKEENLLKSNGLHHAGFVVCAMLSKSDLHSLVLKCLVFSIKVQSERR